MGSDDTQSKYPTLDRVSAVQEESQAVGQFIEWLRGQGVELMQWRETVEDERVCTLWVADHSRAAAVDELRRLQAEIEGGDPAKVKPVKRSDVHPDNCECKGTGWLTFYREGWVNFHSGGINALLYRYFEIDENQAEKERRALLDEVRARNP